MRTKHVLMTTALLSLFAACTNDDFVSYEQGAQSGDAALRPTVDVTLNVSEINGADTRLAYDFDEGYQWEPGKDVIGALLMDKVIAKKDGQDFRPHDDIEAWEEMPWVDRYALTDYVNTDYPFTLQKNGEWKTDAKMLEGNYFFTFPFASYNGNREAIHSIGEQVQDGVTRASLAEAYAKNNFFIGFSRIHAGTEGEEVISSDLEMTPVLGALGVELINTGNQDFTVKKIILQSNAFHTLIKVNPTDANYDGENGEADYNLTGDNSEKLPEGWKSGATFFNYANYEEMVKNGEDWAYAETFEERYNDLSLVNNTKKAYYNETLNYNRQNALRAVIEGIEDVDGADNRAELTVVNAPVMKANTPDVTQQFIIMTNIYKYTDETPINLYIYTDKGMVGPVNISEIQSEVDTDNDGEKNVTVITDKDIREIAPGITAKVTLQIDDNSNQGAWGMPIYNESDLAQFIEWNKDIDRTFTGTLMNNVTLTKEMSDMLMAGNGKLIINTQETTIKEDKVVPGEEHKLVLGEGVAKNILDKVMVRGYVDEKNEVHTGTIEVKNALELGSNSYVTGTYNIGNETTVLVDNVLEVAEGASVTVVSPIEYKETGNYKQQQLIIAENEGTVTLNAAVAQLRIAENKAEVNINAAATFIGKNYGSNKNLEGATITIGKGAVVNAASKLLNNGKNDNPTEEEEANYAVIINNGTLTDIQNGEWGKVIANEGSITNVDDNKGIVEKSVLSAQVSADAEAYEGVISYTVADKKTLKEIIDGKITKLVIDGGEVSGTAYGSSVPAGHYTANKIKWIEVKGKGGSLGSLIENRGAANQNYFTSLFPNLEEVTTKANATFYDVNFGSSETVAFNIEAATTTIRGWVNSEKYNLDITLGSYDKKNYKGVSATLTLPTTTDKLYAASIKQDGAGENEPSKVINNGFVQLEKNGVLEITGDNWSGVPAGEKPGNKPAAGDGNGNYTLNLSTLAEELEEKDWTNVTSVTINTNIKPDADEFKALKKALDGRDLILDNEIAVDLRDGDGSLMANSLIVNGKAEIGDANANSKKVMLTVNEIKVATDAALTVNESWILVNQEVREGSGDGMTVKGKIIYEQNGGAIKALNNDGAEGAYLTWDNSRGWFK